ncbi:MAG: serine hydrolase domain-containing protein [Bacteroidota bacterium]
MISLEDKVFGPDSILGSDFGTATLTEDHRNISVINLLQFELGGWGTFDGQDPIDALPDVEFREFMEFVFNQRPLSAGPGEAHAYTNMAQWLCARIVEEATGQSFQDYTNSILSPAGITSFKTTTFRRDDRAPNEVEYYDGQEMQFIYTINSRRDGDGGGVMSAPDVLRFLNAIDGYSSRADIISQNSHEILTSPSRFNEFWGAGLAPWPAQNLLWMSGSLPGNRSWVMVGDNQVNAVILLNFNQRNIQQFSFDFQDVMLFIVNNNSIPWQTDLDQF